MLNDKPFRRFRRCSPAGRRRSKSSVAVARGTRRDRRAATAEKLLDQPDALLLGESVSILAATKPGAKLIAEHFIGKKLPRVSSAGHRSSRSSAKTRRSRSFRPSSRGGLLLSLEPGQIEGSQARDREGRSKKGRELYLNANFSRALVPHDGRSRRRGRAICRACGTRWR